MDIFPIISVVYVNKSKYGEHIFWSNTNLKYVPKIKHSENDREEKSQIFKSAEIY